MHHATRITPIVLALAATVGCNPGGDDESLPSTPPTTVELVADSGFRNAGAVESSPDGETFYVAAYTEDGQPAIFSVDVDSGSVSALHVGEPLLYPADLAISCDGSTLYIADQGVGIPDSEFGDPVDPTEQVGGIHVLPTAGGELSKLQATGIETAAGIVTDTDCEALYVTGQTEAYAPALFTVPVGGGVAKIVHEGAPLVSPTGVHVDEADVAWVMDHGARNDQGEGLLFAITQEGEVSEVVGGLGMGRHGGVSLVPGGVTAVIPVRNHRGETELLTANTENGEMSSLPTPQIIYPTGTAAARNAPVMAVTGEQSISIATFDSE